jgi:ribonuclease Z
LNHRVPTYGFIFREKKRDVKILKDAIDRYSIPISEIRYIKGGADFVAADGEVIANESITVPSPKPLSYAYCSDTATNSRIAGFVRDVDLLYHEATFDSSKKSLAKETGHSTSDQAAAVALEAGAGTLVIGHFSARYKDAEVLLEEARSLFPRTFAAKEGLTIDVADCRKS